MTEKNVQKILKEGSMRQKIKLYMTDTALFNLTYSRDTALLTDKQRLSIHENIKETKDIEYYDKLRLANRSFLIFKEHIPNFHGEINRLRTACYTKLQLSDLHLFYEGLINDLIEATPENRDTLLDLAVEKTKKYKGKKQGSKVRIGYGGQLTELWSNIEELTDYVEGIKYFFDTLKVFLSKDLPIKPYKDYVAKFEKSIIKLIDEVVELQETFKAVRPKELDLLLPYKDIPTNKVTQEDVDNIKNAGV